MKTLEKCRICNSTDLVKVLELGNLTFTGIFPVQATQKVPQGELNLYVCNKCSLGQLDREFEPLEMYGIEYGYRSGLNKSMVTHLSGTASKVAEIASLKAGDTVLDIGSNDGTLLSSYKIPNLKLVGIDPTIQKFKEFYRSDIITKADFFSAASFAEVSNAKAKVVTSIAMFYDLPKPLDFANDVRKILEDDGVWYLELSYAPWMVESGAFDTVCHEHLEYYSLHSLDFIMANSGLKVVHLELNDANGGSLAMAVTPKENDELDIPHFYFELLQQEKARGFDSASAWRTFQKDVNQKTRDLSDFLVQAKIQRKKVVALGASTKGNVLLQALGPVAQNIQIVGEVNPDKFGRFTPGTIIPIVSEQEALESKADIVLVLPWHFRETFDRVLENFVSDGGVVVYPLPALEIISKESLQS